MTENKTPAIPGTDTPIITVAKGVFIGIANIIPGVSGGTFALILGVFDRMVAALNALGPRTIKAVIECGLDRFRKAGRQSIIAEWQRIDGTFLLLLFAGMIAAISFSSFLIDYLLKYHVAPTLAFFIGLILPSIAIPWAMMKRRGLTVLWVVPGVALTLGVSLIMPDSGTGSDNLALALLTGAITVSAMILPGLSGSYVMLVMGQYQNVITKLTGLQRGLAHGQIDVGAVLWLGALAVGIGIGMLLFARLLNFLLARFRSATMAFLIGLLLGSLWVLWPFKDVASGAEVVDRQGEVKEEVKIATADNRMPQTSTEGLIGGGSLVAGLVCSGGLIAMGRRRKESTSN
ncbi:MAG: DUF368 domain-containing protein [Myxococcota bacterium]|nr:DUF368 domain-containing protein [Myxococcota bacterium]